MADYPMQRLEAIAKYHAVVFLALAYLQWHAVHLRLSDHAAQPRLADVIYQHRQEHYRQLIGAVARMTLEVGAVEPVLDHFLRRRPPACLCRQATPPVSVSTERSTLSLPCESARASHRWQRLLRSCLLWRRASRRPRSPGIPYA